MDMTGWLVTEVSTRKKEGILLVDRNHELLIMWLKAASLVET
jgi:hypothetical protein